MARSPLDYCPGCQRDLPVESFALRTSPVKNAIDDPEFGAGVVCQECRDAGRGPVDPSLAKIRPQWRKVLRDYLSGRYNMKQIAVRAGLSPTYVRNLLNGHGKGHPGAIAVQQAFQNLLEAEGLDLYSIARMSRACLYATRPYWNPKEEKWEHFPDFHTRQLMVKHLTKLHRLDPSPAAFQANLTNITFNVGLDGSQEESQGHGGGYTIDVEGESEDLAW